MSRQTHATAGPAARPRILVVESSPELADRIRAAGAHLDPVPDVVARPRLRSGEPESVSAFDVLVVGPSHLDRGGFRRLAELHRKIPSTAVVLVIDRRPEATLRDIVRAGAVDALPLDIDDEELELALERAVSLGRRQSGQRSAGTADAPLRPRGRVITVGSPTDGCGKTFVAANTALFLAGSGAKVVLVDLDLQFGEMRTALRAKADFSIVDALSSEADGHELEAVLPELAVHLPNGFSVLVAPRDPAEADRVGPGDVARIIDALRGGHDYVVVDTPTGLAEHVLPVLDVTDQLLVVGTPDRPSVHNVGVFLKTLERLGLDSEVALVLNKAESDADSGEEQVPLPRSLRAIIPYDREVARSINLGVPILHGSPAAPAAQKLLAFLERLVPAPLPTTSPAPPERPQSPEFSGPRQDQVAPPAAPAETTEDWTRAPAAEIDGRTDDDPEALPAPDHLPPEATPAQFRCRVTDGTWLPPARARRRPPVGPPRTGPHRHHPAPRGNRLTRAPPGPGRKRPRRRTPAPHPTTAPAHQSEAVGGKREPTTRIVSD